MITVRRAKDRGRANLGWLDSRHTFSFGHYYDAKHMGFSALRVINDDLVQPSAGFDTHGHRNMEIISYVLQGAIEHKDSANNIHILPAGQFQLMSAGKGIYHSEFNASTTDTLRFLQIWIAPNAVDNKPSYQQKNFGRAPGLTPIATPTGENNTLLLKQSAKLQQLILKAGDVFDFQPSIGSQVYIHQVAGKAQVNNLSLSAGDGAKVNKAKDLRFINQSNDEMTAFIFELP